MNMTERNENESSRKRRRVGSSSHREIESNVQGTQIGESETSRSLIWGEVLSQSAGQNTRFLTEVVEGTQPKMNRMVINKNDSIKKRISKILKLLQEKKKESDIEILLIASGKSIQKLVTIVEIVKQKIGIRREDTCKLDKAERNRRNAKIDGMDKVVIGIQEAQGLRFYFDQFNYLDYSLMSGPEFQMQQRKKTKKSAEVDAQAENIQSTLNTTVKENGGYTRKELEVLKLPKDVKIPVFYSYMNFRPEGQDSTLSDELQDKFTGLSEEGWSRQRE